jgi:hypothetical protein
MPEPVPNLPSPPIPTVPPVPLPEQMSVWWKVGYWAPATYLRGHLAVHAFAFWTMAASMWLQSERYTFGTNRGLLFLVAMFTPKQWALIFGLVGTVKAVAALTYPRLARWVVLSGMLVLSWWAVGFATAWLVGNSTILGLVAWTLLLGEHFAALTLIDGKHRWREGK